MSGGFTPCRHLRPSSGREHSVFVLIQSGDDDDAEKKDKNTLTTEPFSDLRHVWNTVDLFYPQAHTGAPRRMTAITCLTRPCWEVPPLGPCACRHYLGQHLQILRFQQRKASGQTPCRPQCNYQLSACMHGETHG